MDEITVAAPAKINLTLDVVGLRNDGYHNIESIMHQVDLCDYVTVSLVGDGIEVITDNSELPGGSANLAFRAARQVLAYRAKTGIRISIEKNIPLGAGLAGGSSDAAAVIQALNRLMDLDLSYEQMAALGLEIGSDVPFCLMGGTALAQGRGEILTAIPANQILELVLCNPGFEVSTAQIFALMDREEITVRPDNRQMVLALQAGDLGSIADHMINVMEQATFSLHPVLGQIKAALTENGARGVLMSGSGPTIFGIYPDRETADQAWQMMNKRYPRVYRASSYRRNGDQ